MKTCRECPNNLKLKMAYDAYVSFIEHIEYNSTMIQIINGISTYSYITSHIMNIKKFDMKIGTSYRVLANCLHYEFFYEYGSTAFMCKFIHPMEMNFSLSHYFTNKYMHIGR